MMTEVHVYKIKDKETGGKPTMLNEPLRFDYNSGLGFTIGGKKCIKMKTVNSISGGKTSAYIAANYPADYNVFALVRTDDKSCMYPDAKVSCADRK